MHPEVTGYVLAGGQSLRMGTDKAFLTGNGELLIEHALRKLRKVCCRVKILSGPRNQERDALLSRHEHLVPDQQGSHAGPLAGVAVALADCSTEYALLLAVDQVEMTADGLRHLVKAGTATQSAAACFQTDARPEPVPLLVSHRLRQGIQDALARGERRLLTGVQACAAGIDGKLLLLPFPAASTSAFLNLNTPDDLAQWCKRQNGLNPSASRASE